MTDSLSKWQLARGDKIVRKKLHDLYGGPRQGGISPSAKSPNVMLFSDHQIGELHGYRDRWDGDLFLYVGEGQVGDQQMVRRNKAILDHLGQGRALRLFSGCRGVVQYVGEFRIDMDAPWFTNRAPSTDNGPERNVIVFRLLEVL